MRTLPWCYVQPGGETFGETVMSALGQWRNELILELDYVGYAITYNEAGQVEVSHVLARKRRESVFFDEFTTPSGLRRSGVKSGRERVRLCPHHSVR